MSKNSKAILEHLDKWQTSEANLGPGRLFVVNSSQGQGASPALSTDLQATLQTDAQEIQDILFNSNLTPTQKQVLLKFKYQEIYDNAKAALENEAWEKYGFWVKLDATNQSEAIVALTSSHLVAVGEIINNQLEIIVRERLNQTKAFKEKPEDDKTLQVYTTLGLLIGVTSNMIKQGREFVEEKEGIKKPEIANQVPNENAAAHEKILTAETLNKQLTDAVSAMLAGYIKLRDTKHRGEVHSLVDNISKINSGNGTAIEKYNKIVAELFSRFQIQFDNHTKHNRGLFSKTFIKELSLAPNHHHYSRMLALTLKIAMQDKELFAAFKDNFLKDNKERGTYFTNLENNIKGIAPPTEKEDKKQVYQSFVQNKPVETPQFKKA